MIILLQNRFIEKHLNPHDNSMCNNMNGEANMSSTRQTSGYTQIAFKFK